MKMYVVEIGEKRFKTNDRLLAFEFSYKFSILGRIINWYLGYTKV